MANKTITRDNYLEKVNNAIEIADNTIGATLGPNGRSIIINNDMGSKTTKDGVTVAKAINVKDSATNAILKLITEASDKLNVEQGDGTTSCVVYLSSMIRNSIHDVRVNVATNVYEYFNGMKHAIKQISDHIRKSTVEIKHNYQKIKQVAFVASNGDDEISDLITKAHEEISKNSEAQACISCYEGHGRESTLEVVEGMSLDRGYVSPYFITNEKKKKCVLEDPMILIYDKKISTNKQIVKALEFAASSGKSILIIAEEVENEALRTLVINKLGGSLKAAAIKAPGFGERRGEILEDIAILTGGHVVSESKGHNIDEILDWNQFFGSAKTVTINKDETIIVDGSGNKKSIQERVESIKLQISESNSDYDKEKLQERMSKLGSGVAKINIVAATEAESKEKLDRLEDAKNAAKQAIEGGVVPGGGTCIAKAAKYIVAPKNSHSDFIKGLTAVKKSCYAGLTKVLSNSHIENYQVIVDQITNHQNDHYGYDVRSGKIGDMHEMGIIDPASVELNIIKVSFSIACEILRSLAIISDDAEEEKSSPAPNMPPMM